MDVAAFILGQLPRGPARVLEVGCGDGQLARTLAAHGYAVVGDRP